MIKVSEIEKFSFFNTDISFTIQILCMQFLEAIKSILN